MSSLEGISPEPQKLFLVQLLTDDQLAGHLLIRGDVVGCRNLMYWIVLRVRNIGIPKTQVDPLFEKLRNWRNGTTPDTVLDVEQAREELSELLSTHFYSELNLGIVQTSSLKATKDVPSSEPIAPGLSSKLR